MGALSLVGPALFVALFPFALLALFLSPPAGSTKPLALNAFILALASAFLGVSGLVRLADADHVFVHRILELSACTMAAWITIWLLPSIAPRPFSGLARPAPASASRASLSTHQVNPSTTTMGLSGRDTQSSFLPPISSSVSILPHRASASSRNPHSFDLGSAFSGRFRGTRGHHSRNRNSRSLLSSFSLSNLSLDALPWNIVFITHLLTYFLVIATIISLITLLPLVVRVRPQSGGPSRPLFVPAYLGPIFQLTLHVIIDGLIVAFIPLHLPRLSASSSPPRSVAESATRTALGHTLALGFVQSFAVALSAYELVSRAIDGSVAGSVGKHHERQQFVRDMVMLLWIGGITLVGCLLRFDHAPTRAANAVEHIAGTSPAPMPTTSSSMAELHRRRIEAYALPSSADVRTEQQMQMAQGTPTFVIGEPDHEEKVDEKNTKEEGPSVVPLPSPPPTPSPAPAPEPQPASRPASVRTASPSHTHELGLLADDPDLSPLALKSLQSRNKSRTRVQSNATLTSLEKLNAAVADTTDDIRAVDVDVGLESIQGIEPLVFGDALPVVGGRTRKRTISFDQSPRPRGDVRERGRSKSLGQIAAIGELPRSAEKPSRIPRPVHPASKVRARAVSAPLATAVPGPFFVPREVISPASISHPLDNTPAEETKKDFVLSLDGAPPSPLVGLGIGLGIGLGPPPSSRRMSSDSSRGPMPPRPSHPPPLSPRSVGTATTTTSRPRARAPSAPVPEARISKFESPRRTPRPPIGSSPHSATNDLELPSAPIERERTGSVSGGANAALGWMGAVITSVVRGAKELINSPSLNIGSSSSTNEVLLPLPVSAAHSPAAARASGVMTAVALSPPRSRTRVASGVGKGKSFLPSASVFDDTESESLSFGEANGNGMGKNLKKNRTQRDVPAAERFYLHPSAPPVGHSQSYTSFPHPSQQSYSRTSVKQLRPSRSSVTVGMKASTALSLLSTSSAPADRASASISRASLVVSPPMPVIPDPEEGLASEHPRKAPLPPIATSGAGTGSMREGSERQRRPSLLKLAERSASKLSLVGLKSVSPVSPLSPSAPLSAGPSPIPSNATPSSGKNAPKSMISSPPSSYPSTHHPTPGGVGATPTTTTGTHRTSHSASSTLSSAIDPVNYPVPPPPPAHLAEIFSAQSRGTFFSSPSSPSLTTPASTSFSTSLSTNPSSGPNSEIGPIRHQHHHHRERKASHVHARRRSPTHTHSRSVSIDMEDLKRAILPLSPSDDFLVGLGEDPFASMPSTPLLMNAPTTTTGAAMKEKEDEKRDGEMLAVPRGVDVAMSPTSPRTPVDFEKDLPGLPRQSLSTSASDHGPIDNLPSIPDELSSTSTSPQYHLKSKWSESTTGDYSFGSHASADHSAESSSRAHRRRSSHVTFAEPLTEVAPPWRPSPTPTTANVMLTRLKRSVSDPLAPVHAFMRSSVVLGSPVGSGSATPQPVAVNGTGSNGGKWRRASAAAMTSFSARRVGSASPTPLREVDSRAENRAEDVRFLESIVKESLLPGVITTPAATSTPQKATTPSRLPKRSPIPIFNLPSGESDVGSSEESYGPYRHVPGLSIDGLLAPEGTSEGDTTITPLSALVAPGSEESHDRNLTPTPTSSGHDHRLSPFALTIPDSSSASGSLTPTPGSPSLAIQSHLLHDEAQREARIPRPTFTSDAHANRARRAASLSPNASLSMSLGGARIRTSRRFPTLDPNWMQVNQRLDFGVRQGRDAASGEELRRLRRHQSLDARLGLGSLGGHSVPGADTRRRLGHASKPSAATVISSVASPSSPLFRSTDAIEDFSMLVSSGAPPVQTPPPRESNPIAPGDLQSKPLPATPPRLTTRTISGTATPVTSPGRLLPASAFQPSSVPPSPSENSHRFSASSPGGSPSSPGRKRVRPGLTLNLEMTNFKMRTSKIPVATLPPQRVLAASYAAPVLMTPSPSEVASGERVKSNSVSTSATVPSTTGTFGQSTNVVLRESLHRADRNTALPSRPSEDSLHAPSSASAGSSSPRSFLPTLDSPTPSSDSEDDVAARQAILASPLDAPRFGRALAGPRVGSVGLGFSIPSRQASSYIPGPRLRTAPLSPIPTVSEVESGQSIYYSALPTPTTPFSAQSPASNASTSTLDRFSPMLVTPPPFAHLSSQPTPSLSPPARVVNANTKALPLSIPEEAEDAGPTRSPSIAVGSMVDVLSPPLSFASPTPSSTSERSRRSRLNSLFKPKSRSSRVSVGETVSSTMRTGTVRSQASHSSDAAFEMQEFGVRSPDGEDQMRRTPTLSFSNIGRSSMLNPGTSSQPPAGPILNDFAFEDLGLDFEV